MVVRTSFRQKLLHGQPLHFTLKAPRKKRTLLAEWLQEAVVKGLKLDIRNAIIRGPLDLSRVTFEHVVRLVGCEILDGSNFSHSIFRHDVILSGTRFRSRTNTDSPVVSFHAAKIQGDAFFGPSPEQGLPAATFEGEANFGRIEINGQADFSGSIFKQKVSFNDAKIGRDAIFHAEPEQGKPAVTFEGEADFCAVEVTGQADFSGAVFKREASFNGAKFRSDAFFGAEPEHRVPAVRFVGKADFGGVQIGGQADFSGAVFEKEVSFNGARIEADGIFRAEPLQGLPSVTFKREADFGGVQIGGDADFSGAIFKKSAIFSGAKIDGDAFFRPVPEQKTPAVKFEGEVDFGGVKIGGDVDFSGALFKKAISFGGWIGGSLYCQGAQFRDEADFNGVTAKNDAFFRADPDRGLPAAKFVGKADFGGVQIGGQADFSGAVFKQDFILNAAKIGGDAFFCAEKKEGTAGTIFVGEADFGGAEIDGQADFSGASFGGDVSFNRAKIDGDAFFRSEPEQKVRAVRFEGEADFVGMQIGGDADFRGVQFNCVDKSVSFESAEINDDALFTEARFASQTEFLGARIGGELQLLGSEFIGDVSFNGVWVKGGVYCGVDPEQAISPAVFRGEADFVGMQIGGDADFEEVRFISTKKPASFDGAKINGDALFTKTEFATKTSFVDIQVGGSALFQRSQFLEGSDPSFAGAQFHGQAIFDEAVFCNPVDFRGSCFSGLAQFSSAEGQAGSVFKKTVSFEHSRFEHDARFDYAVFQGDTSFREASFRAVYFSPSGRVRGKDQFERNVDIRGCTYERIAVGHRLLFKHLLGAQEPKEYDRQPYTQLEKVFRAVGQDGEADEVYLERRYVEHQHLSIGREPYRWFGDWLYRWVARYGVRPYRLIVIPLILIALGAFVFLRPIAVEIKSDKQPAELAQSKAPIRNKTDASTQRREVFTGWDALRLSIRLFLPVEVPLATRWKPSDKPFGPLRFSDYATLLKLAGWVLVPLGIAALTGLLRRVAP